jgi:hypothetical protein
MGVVRKRDVQTPVPSDRAASGGGEFSSAFPGLFEMLSLTQYSDGAARRTATLTVFCDAGECKVCLNDRDNGLTAWASGDDVFGAMRALEAALVGDTVVWRAAGQDLRKGRGRR